MGVLLSMQIRVAKKHIFPFESGGCRLRDRAAVSLAKRGSVWGCYRHSPTSPLENVFDVRFRDLDSWPALPQTTFRTVSLRTSKESGLKKAFCASEAMVFSTPFC